MAGKPLFGGPWALTEIRQGGLYEYLPSHSQYSQHVPDILATLQGRLEVAEGVVAPQALVEVSCGHVL